MAYKRMFDQRVASLLAALWWAECLPAQATTFRNPILSGFHADPSICRVGDDYYLVNSSFEYFPGVPVYHSKDLVHWKQIGHCLTRSSQLPLQKMRASGGIFAPTLRYHDGVFYMITTNVSGGGNFFVTATDPAGPWSEPVWLDPGGIDPSLLFDDDGRVYYCRHEGGGDGYIGLCEIDVAAGKLRGELKNIWGGTGGIWAEGPHLYKIHGKYYLLISEGGTSYNHSLTIARSNSPWGPYEPCPSNPILTHRDDPTRPLQAVGHADLIETPAGWWLVCLAIRPQNGHFHHIGRETCLAPVTWTTEGWPTVNNSGHIDLEMPAPKLPPHQWPPLPERDEFTDKQLANYWEYLRNPVAKNYSLQERSGFLRLKGSPVSLSEADSPTWVGRKQTALTCQASTLLSFDPVSENEEAGLVVRGNDENHYVLGVKRRGDKQVVFCRQVLQGETIEPTKYRALSPGPVQLTIEADPSTYHFYFRPLGEESQLLGTAKTQDLSSEKIGGFTGVYWGLYASGNGQEAVASADFDWFQYHKNIDNR